MGGETVAGPEPERELIVKISPFALPVAVLAFVVGSALDGSGAGWSAAIAIGVVYLNFLAHGWSMAWAGGVGPVMVYAVGLGGFMLRLAIAVAIMVVLRQFIWFSTLAFIAALIPSTIALLIAEMKLMAGRMQADMWTFPSANGTGR
jgi:hypothetical protein